MDDHPQNQPFASRAHDPELRGNDPAAIDGHPVPHPLQGPIRRADQRQDVVLLVKLVARVHDPVGDLTIVR
jgi:hypothetical protein